MSEPIDSGIRPPTDNITTSKTGTPEKVLKPEREKPVAKTLAFFEYRSPDLSPAENEKITNEKRQEREQLAQGKVDYCPPYDFSSQLELQRDLDQVVEISRNVLSETFLQAGLTPDEVEKQMANLEPHYFAGTHTNPLEEVRTAGLFDNNTGLMWVWPEVDKYFPIRIGHTIGHEFSHAAQGVRELGDNMTVNGLSRQGEGLLVEEAMAELDAARIFEKIKEQGNLFTKDVRRLSKTLEFIDEDFLASLDSDDPHRAIFSRAIEAKQLAIPSTWIEAHADNARGLDELVLGWKLSRMVGFHLTPNSDRDGLTDTDFFQKGFNFITEARARGKNSVHTVIRELFGAEANHILHPKGHRTAEEREAFLHSIKTRETEMNPTWERKDLTIY